MEAGKALVITKPLRLRRGGASPMWSEEWLKKGFRLRRKLFCYCSLLERFAGGLETNSSQAGTGRATGHRTWFGVHTA